MSARHQGCSKKIFMIFLIVVTALVISGIVIYIGRYRAEEAMDLNKLSEEVKSVGPSVGSAETNEAPLPLPSPSPSLGTSEPLTKPVIAQPKSTAQESSLPFNRLVLAQIGTYNKESYPYLLNTDYKNYNGVTSTLHYQGKVLLKANPSGNRASHCVGITFEVFFRAMEDWNQRQGYTGDSIKGLNYDQLYDFILKWYSAGPKTENNLVIALEKYKLGKRITNFEDARPGDFIDFSRENQTGHTVVLIDWVRDNGKIVGLRYWSSQESTNGIGYKTEYFNILRSDGTKYGNIMQDKVYIGRAVP